ncbi:hypothetical protein [Glycomyces paridis]|uniref:Integral membrane protein n=1 Tax=Glycomyces paridis TaxID=2126555 RepID=A0A4S8PJH3_9ACTN|nr:hypothetical protein [Glycomyces paridis]THV30843.1 hypothetical protein E9998_05570 [Glycomyces paridis]
MADAALNRAEREELERLRAQAARSGGVGRGARWTGAVVLLVLSAVLALLATVTVFARNEILDTDRFVDNMEPLLDDDDVRAAVAARVSTAVTEALDVEALIAEAIDAVQTRGAPDVLSRLAGPLASGVDSFIDKQVHTVVYSDQFTELWRQANRTAHAALVAILTGEQGRALAVQGQNLVLDLGPVVERVKDRMVDAGFDLAERIPAVSVTFTLATSDAFPKLQVATALLNAAAWALPIAALALLAAGVALAPVRRRGLLLGVVFTAGAMFALWGALVIGRSVYLAALSGSVQSPDAAGAVYDALTRYLLAGAQTLAVLALIVALACWLLGPGRAATGTRSLARGARDALARVLTRAGLTFGPVGGAVQRFRRPVEFLAVIVGLLWIVLWRHPGVSGVVTVAIVVAVFVAFVEVVARVGRGAPEAAPE